MMERTGLSLENACDIPSPALLVWPDRVQANLDAMIKLAGDDPTRLRPHVKTHKMEAVVRLQLAAGITKFKAATIAEVEMALSAGANDVLLAYPPVGPNQQRLVELAHRFPEARLAFIAENAELVSQLAEEIARVGVTLAVFLDLDCGMGRTGTTSSTVALEVARAANEAVGLSFAGIHAYDGHVRVTPVAEREAAWSAAIAAVDEVAASLAEDGVAVGQIVGGGSPTFGFHATQRGWQCSPGTTLFWDGGYGASFPDLPFAPAAAVLSRIISKPGANRLCLDLGHKAIASEGPLETRVRLVGLEDARAIGHSEEHLVVEVEDSSRHAVGEEYLGVPHHICPTVALHQEAVLVRDGRATGERWPVTARDRRLGV